MFINFCSHLWPSHSKDTNTVLDEHFRNKSNKTSKFTLRNNFYVSRTEIRPVQVTDSSCLKKNKSIHVILMFSLFFHRCKDLEILYRQALPLYLAAVLRLLLYASLPGHTAEQLYDRHQFPAEFLDTQEKTLKHKQKVRFQFWNFKCWVFFPALQKAAFHRGFFF